MPVGTRSAWARQLLRPAEDLNALFYPRVCLACDQQTPLRGGVLCLACRHYLRPSDFHLHYDNDVTDRFWGRVPLVHGTALYYFVKAGRIQRLIHRLKYENKPHIGLEMGQMLGQQIKASPFYSDLKGLVPVPLHARRERERGYNQAELIARGMADVLQVPVHNIMFRREATRTQTRKSRLERFGNVSSAFDLSDSSSSIHGQHLVLVDDVITTGATLEACALRLLREPGVRISVAAIALAR